MKYPFLFVLALSFAFAPTGNATLMLDKEITAAILKRDGNAAPKAEDVKALAESLKKEFGLRVSYRDRGNSDISAISEVELFGVRSSGPAGTLDYSRRRAADPIQIAYLQLKQVQAAMRDLSPRERTLIRRREVDIVVFADSVFRAHHVIQHDNEIQIVNAARAQACQKISHENQDYMDHSDRELVEGVGQGVKTLSCPIGAFVRGFKDVAGGILGIESQHKVGYLHSKDYVKNEFRERVLGLAPRLGNDDDDRARRAGGFPAPGAEADDGPGLAVDVK